jgi:hypothetical protein
MDSPPGAEIVSLLGVNYVRQRTADGGDLFLTEFGFPFAKQLAPENWHEPKWFAQKRVRLEGTSTIYRVPTMPVCGVSLDLIVRYSRVGQEIMLDRRTMQQNPDAAFNSPFEEFALVMELRATRSGPAQSRMFTKKAMAIYVPATQLKSWQTGRLESTMAIKAAQHPEVGLDIQREYLVLYGWIKGLNAVQASRALGMTGATADNFLAETTLRAIVDMKQRGFRVVDMKPEHVVVRMVNGRSLLRRRDGNLAYALIDYELLERLSPENLQVNTSTLNEPCES